MTSSQPAAPPTGLGRAHARRLREVYRSAGWPCQDGIELELLAAGLLERVRSDSGHEHLRLTDAGIAHAALQRAAHRAAFSPHEALAQQVAAELARAGRIAWCGLSLRAQVPAGEPAQAQARWCVARPDVFSIRNTTVADYVEPVVHEVKVRRADLLADLRLPDKRAAYLDLGECWYVLGRDAHGRDIGAADEIPPECGVLLERDGRFECARPALRRERRALPFGIWMALARAAPFASPDADEAQGRLGECQ